jgi:hypothetical protein
MSSFASLQQLKFHGALLKRGFWLYVWEVVTEDGKTVLYVGRTGDSSSPHAQSPFNRLSQHHGSNKHANALRRQLLSAKIEPETCRSFEMVAYGPILPEVKPMDAHRASRDIVAKMEKDLCDALCQAGYEVLNTVNCRHKRDHSQWQSTLDAFAQRFPKLLKAM